MDKHAYHTPYGYYPPHKLKTTQEWFAGIITNRLAKEDRIQSYTPKGFHVAEESAYYITPGPNLQPHERIQIYNQQYWWRLINTLHANFPLVARLFGSQAFNEKICVPYLMQCPPNSWSLNVLGERLPRWLLKNYHEPDQTLIYNAACLDWTFMSSYIVVQHPPLDLVNLLKDPDSLLAHTIYLQPHIQLFSWEYDLFSFRTNFLKEDIDHWIDNPFPELLKEKNYHFILFRNSKNKLSWLEISRAEFLLLNCFKNGSSVQEACNYIEAQDVSIYEEVEAYLQKWLQNWTQARWLTSEYAYTQ